MNLLRRVLAFLVSGAGVALATGLLLVMVGSVSIWLRFPMSAPVAGTAVPLLVPGLPGLGLPIGTLFFGLLVFMLVASLLRWRLLTVVAWGLAWLALFYFPWQLIFHDPQWLLQFMRDSVMRGDLQRFNNSHMMVNKGVEPSLMYITDFEHLTDRASLVWRMLGWGWILSLLGLMIFAIGQFLRRGFPVSARNFLLLSVLSPVLLMMGVGISSLIGDWQHYRGDHLLATGAPKEAVQAYAKAIHRDPLLGHSAAFLTKVSKAYYLAYGAAEPHAHLYLLNEELVLKVLNAAESRLASMSSVTLAPSPFSASMTALIRKKRAETYLGQSLFADKVGELNVAIKYYQWVLQIDPTLVNAQYFLAKTLMDVRNLDAGMQIALTLPDKVYHTSVKADFYSLIGDGYRLQGQMDKAREAYSASYELDSKDNYRPLKELSGT